MIYEYRCNECNRIEERNQHHTEVGDYPCKCNGLFKRYFTRDSLPYLSTACFESRNIIDVETLKPMSMSEIKKKEKETGKVFMGINEHHQECEYRKNQIEQETNATISKEFTELAQKNLAISGIE